MERKECYARSQAMHVVIVSFFPMPHKGIVKSGHAGNSSKSGSVGNAKSTDSTSSKAAGEQSLFPPGSKYPASLLHERCQKNGWEKPILDTRRQPDGYSFVVILSRTSKKDSSEKESVRLEPHPPYISPSSLEARHWGATYALYRFCNSLQLNRVLPRGPAEYWNQLAVEHKASPEHLKWMYDPDPFAARKEVEERQDRAAQKRAQINASSEPGASSRSSGSVHNEFSKAPEVRMATSLRDRVEEAVKQGIALYSGGKDSELSIISDDVSQHLVQQLMHLGFKYAQSRGALEFLSQSSPTAEKLLSSFSPLDAAIEYLVLHLPEEALPERFMPSSNSSNPFVTGAYSGSDDLKVRWMFERAVKEAGWPKHLVDDLKTDTRFSDDWDMLLVALGKKLVGDEISMPDLSSLHTERIFQIEAQEVEAFGGHFEGSCHLVMPMFTAPVTLHVMISSQGLYPSHIYAPMYITGPSTPAYIRLHLLSKLLLSLRDTGFQQDDEGFCSAAMRRLEEVWAQVEDDGPPDMSQVLKYALPTRSSETRIVPERVEKQNPAKPRHRIEKWDTRSNAQIKAEFKRSCEQEKYQELVSLRKQLPAFKVKDKFLNLLSTHRVVVIVGETGCGKTTQLPQFILDSLIQSNQGSDASILVTQPRRLAAIGVATRVSAERLDDGSVGYAIRGESKRSEKTKLLFCTTGIVLRRLSLGDRLEDVTHIVVDEVHERSVDCDFLLLELKELLSRHSTLKIILMSATINHETFPKYFGGAPLLTIPGVTHPVSDKYLEDFIQDLDYRPNPRFGKSDKLRRAPEDALKSQELDEATISVIQTIAYSNSIDYQLIAALVRRILNSGNRSEEGAILIFLPGVQEIRQCIDSLLRVLEESDTIILPLHANLTNEEQIRIFAKTSKRRVIASTNIAETSITIDDVTYVIDAGKAKELHYDSDANISKFHEVWITRAAARQRRGRTGRTRPGTCYKLYTRKQEETMADFAVPEILRVPLDSICLTVKTVHEDQDVKNYLARAIDPPEISAIDRAWSVLGELGAVDEQGKLTSLGRHISMLPIDLRLGKMLILGTIFRCIGPVLTITACLSSKPLFISPMEKREEASKARARFAKGNSDLLTEMHAYEECQRVHLKESSKTFQQFCDQNFISRSSLREISTLRRDYLGPLADIGFIPLSATPDSLELNVNSSNNENLLKAIILGGLWPNIVRIQLPRSAIKFDKVQGGTVQRENTAKEYRLTDLRGERVFLHPSSVLFGHASWKSPYAVYFLRLLTTKLYIKDATEIPIWSILLFGGPISINHIAGGLTVGGDNCEIKLKAWPRIGILANHIRRLLDAQLQRYIEEGSLLNELEDGPVINAMLALLAHDGMTG
ncbi:hypothetical protein D9757_010848 [Collybiopsis confluens]|uniref:RNA helicase n=1 Tax=Collybiopsis confluens TaxID=2823264 RepID=A0A8H5LRP9_9AGAR|nr:hypothetical protein D9757_010848 [Collybiopsis confluens]